MRDLMADHKELRLHGMVQAWEALAAQGEDSTASSKWLLEHLLQQEQADRAHAPYECRQSADTCADQVDAQILRTKNKCEQNGVTLQGADGTCSFG